MSTHQHSSGSAYEYTITGNTVSNSEIGTSARDQCVYDIGLTIQKRGCGTRHTKILAHQT